MRSLVDQRLETRLVEDRRTDLLRLGQLGARVFAGYQKVAARHQHALNRLRNARQILFRANVGRLRFQPRTGGRLDAVHEVFTTFADPDDPAPTPVQPEAFLVQVAPLGPEDEDPPSRLRRRALQPPAGGA